MSKLDDEVVAFVHLSLDGRPEVIRGVERTGRSTRFATVIDGDGVGVEECLQVHTPSSFGGCSGFVVGHRTVAYRVYTSRGGYHTKAHRGECQEGQMFIHDGCF